MPTVSIHVVDHPLVAHKLTVLRDARTDTPTFRSLADELVTLLAYEATRNAQVEPTTVTTPVAEAAGVTFSGPRHLVVPVLRAGLGMLDAILELIPGARVGHIGLQRDESTAIASQYYSKLPKGLASSVVLMIDPMLATGGSAVAAIDLIKAAGATAISMICIVSAPEGLSLLERAHPDVAVYTPVVDKELNAHKFIVPGLGDFGDRLYGTV